MVSIGFSVEFNGPLAVIWYFTMKLDRVLGYNWLHRAAPGLLTYHIRCCDWSRAVITSRLSVDLREALPRRGRRYETRRTRKYLTAESGCL